MSTTWQVIERARRRVLNGRRELAGTLGADLSDSATSITLSAAITGLAAGAILEIGLEAVYVTAYTTGATTATVIRGWEGTMPADHASGEIVRVNPPAPSWVLLGEINNTLASLSAPINSLYRVGWVDLNTGTGRQGYNLDVDAGFVDVIRVRWRENAIGDWLPIRQRDGFGWEIIREAPTTDFATGLAIRFRQAPTMPKTRVWYKAAFTPLSALDEEVTSVSGLQATAVDLLELGATIGATNSWELRRAAMGQQGDTRRADEVQVGAATNALSLMRRQYDQRRSEESQRWQMTWGPD